MLQKDLFLTTLHLKGEAQNLNCVFSFKQKANCETPEILKVNSHLKTEVPHGSVLSEIILLIFMNDLLEFSRTLQLLMVCQVHICS